MEGINEEIKISFVGKDIPILSFRSYWKKMNSGFQVDLAHSQLNQQELVVVRGLILFYPTNEDDESKMEATIGGSSQDDKVNYVLDSCNLPRKAWKLMPITQSPTITSPTNNLTITINTQWHIRPQ